MPRKRTETASSSLPLLDEDDVEEVFRRLVGRDARQKTVPAKVQRDAFRSLVSCMLSAQSPDARTAMASDALFAKAATPEAILALDEDELKALIRPAGLYNMKARNIRALCRHLLGERGGKVPATRDGLMALPGVGRKCADIMLRFVYDQPVIAVDTHVHRICNRLGLARGRTDAQTARHLEARTPRRYLHGGHMALIGYAKRVCRSRHPRCAECCVADLCLAVRADHGPPPAAP
ncbi:endonuclease III domain-containing protein [Marinivivus vitaminiproducens]|uniref:endonuclease III domain-containing protein n=1 Tax=Marinivivus vitaminiproducens TaxID=3035935 RepID=UPI0027A7189A|nr:endonuclease III [Geminicoccaceae bacterium SCSIO 64248]